MARHLWASELAVSQFHARWCPGFTLSHAKRELVVLLDSARRTDQVTHEGQEIWAAGTGGEIPLVVSSDRRRNGMRTVITVLGPGSAAAAR
jgi:hypothetical protein